MLFCRNFFEKNDTFGYLNPILGKLRMTHNLGWWLVGKPMVDFLFAFIERFSLSITVPELWGKMCTVRLFSQWVDLFALKFYLVGSSPISHCWHQKTRDTGLSDGEDRISLCSLVLTQYRSVTDIRTDQFVVAYIECFASRCKSREMLMLRERCCVNDWLAVMSCYM